MEPIAKVKLLAYKAGLPGALLFFSDTCLLTPLTKRGLRGMKPVKIVNK
jgi:hypothetical protein